MLTTFGYSIEKRREESQVNDRVLTLADVKEHDITKDKGRKGPNMNGKIISSVLSLRCQLAFSK